MTRASSSFLVVISWQMRPDFLHLDHALELHLEQQPHLLLFLRILAALLAELCHEPVDHWKDERAQGRYSESAQERCDRSR